MVIQKEKERIIGNNVGYHNMYIYLKRGGNNNGSKCKLNTKQMTGTLSMLRRGVNRDSQV